MAGPTAITFDGAAVDGPGPHVVISEAARPARESGTLSATDADAGDSFTFTLLDDAGGRFFVAGHELRASAGAVLDFENDGSYAVTVRVVDSDNNAFEQTISIGLSDDVFHDVTHGTSDGDDITNNASGQQLIVPGAGDDTVHSSGDIVVFSGARADCDITGARGRRWRRLWLRPAARDAHSRHRPAAWRPGRYRPRDRSLAAAFWPTATTGGISSRAKDRPGPAPTADISISTPISPRTPPVGTSIGTLGGRDITPGDTFTGVDHRHSRATGWP